MNLTDLQYFKTVCELKNMTRASERLGVTQPALSLGVKRLEDHLGIELLVRDSRGVRPTRAGFLLLEQSQSLIEQWNSLKRTVSASETQLQGHLIFGAHDSVAGYCYPAFLPHMASEYPDITFHFKSGLSREMCEGVITHKIDLALVINPTPHPNLIIKEILKDEMALWSKSSGHESTLIYDPSLFQSQELLKKLKSTGLHFERFLHLSNLENIARLVATGLGVGIIPSRVVNHLKGTARLKRYHPDLFVKDRLCLVYHMDNRKLKSLQATVETVKKALS